MPIYRLLQQSAFSPEDISLLVKAYEDCLKELDLPTEPDARTEAVARMVIEIAQTGVRNPEQIRDRVVARLGPPAAGR